MSGFILEWTDPEVQWLCSCIYTSLRNTQRSRVFASSSSTGASLPSVIMFSIGIAPKHTLVSDLPREKLGTSRRVIFQMNLLCSVDWQFLPIKTRHMKDGKINAFGARWCWLGSCRHLAGRRGASVHKGRRLWHLFMSAGTCLGLRPSASSRNNNVVQTSQ